MEIKQLELISFGKWNRKTISLSEGLSYFFGPNEAGKSSIRMFIVYMFFGLKPEERERYTSQFDGQLGGRMVIEIDEQLYTLERFSHKHKGHLTIKLEGKELDRLEVNQVLKGLNRSLFESIFSFEDRDLQQIRQYNREDVGAVLFNIGLTGSDQITQLENQLVKESEELFKKQGRKPPLNEKLLDLKKIQQDISVAEQKEASHQKLNSELDNLSQSIDQFKIDENFLVQEISEMEKLTQVKSTIVKYQILTNEIEELHEVKDLPEEAEERINHVMNEDQLKENQLRQLSNNINKIEQEISDLKEQSKYSLWPLSLTETQHSIQKVIELNKEVDRLQKQLDVSNHDFNNVQNELGIQEDPQSYKDITINHYTNEKWKRLSSQWDQLKSHIQSLRIKQEHQTEELYKQEEQERMIEQKMMSKTEREALQEQYDDLKLEEQKQKLEQQYQDQMATQRSTIKKVNHFVAITKWILPLMIIVLTFMLMVREGFELLTIYGGLTVGSLIAVIAFYGLNKTHKHTKRTIKKLKSNRSQQTSYEDQIKEIRQRLNQEEELENQLQQIQTYIKGIVSNLDEIEKELELSCNQKEEVEEEIEEQVSQYPFLKKFDLYHWPSVYEHLSKGKQLATSINDTQLQIQEVTKEMEVVVAVLLKIVHIYEPEKRLEEPTLVANLAAQYVDKEKALEQKVTQKQEWLDERLIEKKQLSELIDQLQTDLNSLLNQYGSDTVEDFQMKVKQSKLLKEKLQQRSELYEIVYELFNDETNRIVQDKVDWLKLEQELEEKKNSLTKLQKQVEEYRTTQANKQAEINQLEKSGVLSELIHKRSLIEAEITKMAKEWAIKKTAYGFLKDTKNRYQNVYLPDIMEKTSGYFEKITEGRYIDVQFNEDETILVKTVNEQWFNVQQLSEGTADQLYIALRFALNDSLRAYVDFPFILDDAFVHSDIKRKKQVLNIVSEIAKQQQVLYLTCEESERDLLNIEPTSLYVS
ncbi:AAA family ATPase [Piscibacillus sp. B03]